MASRAEAARLAFARAPTEAWFRERGGAALLDPEFPGHRGVPAGRVVSISGGRATVELSSPLGLRDGLLGFDRRGAGEGEASLPRPLPFAAGEIRESRGGRELVRARAGSRVELEVPPALRPGDELFRISSREMDRRAPSPEEYPPELNLVGAVLGFESGRLSARIALPRFDGTRGEGPWIELPPGETIPLERSRAPGGFLGALSLFSESGEADFRLVPGLAAGLVRLASGEDVPPAELFVPPSILKREKNRVYAAAAEAIAAAAEDWARSAAGMDRGQPLPVASPRPAIEAPARSILSFPAEGLPGGQPFATPRVLREGRALPEAAGAVWLPLAPLVAGDDEYEAAARDRVRSELAAGRRIGASVGSITPQAPDSQGRSASRSPARPPRG